MNKFWIVVIIGIILFGFLFYFEPNFTSNSIKKAGSTIKNIYENREINLGQPTNPCETDNDCDTIEKCENECICINGDCFKNVPANST